MISETYIVIVAGSCPTCKTCKGKKEIIKTVEFSFVPGHPLYENFDERLRHHCGPHYKNGWKWKH